MPYLKDFVFDPVGIATSEVWRDQIEPWLDAMYADGLEFRAGLNKEPLWPGSGAMTVEEFHFWRGWCAALKVVRDTPGEKMTEADSEVEEEKRYEAMGKQGDRRGRARELAF